MVLEDIIVGREPEDVRKYGKKGCVYIGKHIVGTGFESHMTNPILMDVTRPHVVLIVGKRGCLTGDTKVFTNNGYKNIENFNEKNDKILSFNIRNLGLEWKDANLLTYDVDANEELFKFKLKDGREIVTTAEHPLLVFHKDVVLQWKKAKDIEENERLITITQLPEIKNDKESLRIARLLGFILADGNMSVRKGRFKDGRGYWYNGTKRRIRIFNAVDELLKTAKDDFEKEFGITAKRYKRNDCNCEVVETKQGKVLDRFVELGVPTGKKHNIIKIPEIVWESSNEFKANFLKALFACDGTITEKGEKIEYYTTSEDFIKGLQLLLAHLSIESNISPKTTKCNGKKFSSYRLCITDYTSLINFRETIGFFDKNKLERAMKRKFWTTKRRKGTRYIENNMVCCRIVKKEKINGIKNVYDLSVPDNHSFIANGIISHNSGKSYTSAVIAEEIMEMPDEIKNNLTCLMIDTMGIFWSMKSQNEKDFNILTEWGLKPRGYPIQHIVPIGLKDFYDKAGIDYDATFAIKPSELSAGDWALTFGVSLYDTLGILLERVIKNLKGKNYKINDIISMIENDKRSEEKDKMALENRFMAAENWGIFSDEATPIEMFLKPGIATVLDVSLQEWSVRNLMLGILSREIYQARVVARREEELALISGEEAKKIPMTWIVMDEAHQFLPAGEETAASHDLNTLVTQGRQPGISLIFITQRPNKLHETAIAQSDLIIAHRLTSKPDLDALSQIMQTYLLEDIKKSISNLPKNVGAALILDDNSERLFNVQIRPRMSWHAGGSPIALKEKI